jgi:hypothetical protein
MSFGRACEGVARGTALRTDHFSDTSAPGDWPHSSQENAFRTNAAPYVLAIAVGHGSVRIILSYNSTLTFFFSLGASR